MPLLNFFRAQLIILNVSEKYTSFQICKRLNVSNVKLMKRNSLTQGYFPQAIMLFSILNFLNFFREMCLRTQCFLSVFV